MEPVTIVAITSAAVKLLSPYIQEATKGFAKKMGEETGLGAISKVSQLYEAIKGKFSGKPAAEEALSDLEKTPQDADAQATLRTQLKKVLEADEAFATELAQLLKGAEEAGANTVFNTNITGDVQKLTNIGTVHGNVSF
jgi:hypothetical protein